MFFNLTNYIISQTAATATQSPVKTTSSPPAPTASFSPAVFGFGSAQKTGTSADSEKKTTFMSSVADKP